ncbi:MAG: hypothetical protein AABX88_02350 [Nanoarchaeota archaeon]
MIGITYEVGRTHCPYDKGILISKIENKKIYCSIEQNKEPFVECDHCDYNLFLEK